MNQELNDKALKESLDQIRTELQENWDDICRMRDIAAVNQAKSGSTARFVFKTSIALSQEPMGDKVLIKAGISCSAGLKSDHDVRMVDLQQELGIDA